MQQQQGIDWRWLVTFVLLTVVGMLLAAAAASVGGLTGCSRPARQAPGPVKQAPFPTPVGVERPDPTDEVPPPLDARGPDIYECQTVCVARYGRVELDLEPLELALDEAAGEL